MFAFAGKLHAERTGSFLAKPNFNVTRVVVSVPVAHRSGSVRKHKHNAGGNRINLKTLDPRLAVERQQITQVSFDNPSCHGCGAALQCLDSSQLGYVKENVLNLLRKFVRTPENPSPPNVCVRCTQLRYMQKAVQVELKEEEYRRVMAERISHRRCLIIWLVDVTDFPISLDSCIADIIGPTSPVVLVGTKIDLLPGPVKEVRPRLREVLYSGWKSAGMSEKCNLVAIHYISAGTNEGVLDLIKDVKKQWEMQGDVFVVGAANAGKSTLYNRLLPVLCGVSGARFSGATVSTWPGTTLRMLRMPFLSRDSERKLKEEARKEISRRLHDTVDDHDPDPNEELFEMLEKAKSLVENEKPVAPLALPATSKQPLLSEEDMTNLLDPDSELCDGLDTAAGIDDEDEDARMSSQDHQQESDVKTSMDLTEEDLAMDFMSDETGLEPVEEEEDAGDELSDTSCHGLKAFDGKMDTLQEIRGEPGGNRTVYLHDTPGLLHPNQTILLLEHTEIKYLQSKKALLPLTISLRPGQCVFLGGMGRLDYVAGKTSIFFSVFCSTSVPVRMMDIKDADLVYKGRLGTGYFKVPHGGPLRVENFPKMESRDFDLVGVEWNTALCDIVLSSIGWVSLTLGRSDKVTVRAHTPGGRGIAMRSSFYPNCAATRGIRRKGSKGNLFLNTDFTQARQASLDPFCYERLWKRKALGKSLPYRGPSRRPMRAVRREMYLRQQAKEE